ncbi:uncharacterized protein LOC132928062 [Rhopalosiphum padi]|uniref:uncharacterized protein LOC132928062 n=1 Tax=Rhopalosiphum padi TaxID=40932 RepID=UPI00298E0699|nr:uncharacterized protein LOC132928062 [Rhopalosiphum padi]
MMSITKILILFVAIVFIGEVVDMHPDIDRPDVPINELSETQYLLKLADSDYTNFGMLSVLLRTRLNSLQTSSPIETTTAETESIASQHAGWRLVNRIRRLTSEKNTNTTVSGDPTQTNNEPKMSALKCLVSLAYPVSLPLQCTQFYFGFLYN